MLLAWTSLAWTSLAWSSETPEYSFNVIFTQILKFLLFLSTQVESFQFSTFLMKQLEFPKFLQQGEFPKFLLTQVVFSNVKKNGLLQYHRKRYMSFIDSRILSPTTCLEILTKQDVDVSFIFQIIRS